MITLIKQPQAFTTLNGAIFQIVSDNPDIIAFNVRVLDAITSALITSQRYYTIPQTPLGTSFDLAPLIAGVVSYQLINDDTILAETPRILKRVLVTVAEVSVDVDGNQVVGADVLINQFIGFNGRLSRFDFSKYVYTNYVISDNSSTRFLSTKPLVSRLYYDSTEYLYFMSSRPASAELNFYKTGGLLVGTKTIDGIEAGFKGYRLNLSPAVLEATFGEELTSMYGHEFTSEFTSEFGTIAHLIDANYFTVRLKGEGGDYLTERRTYVLTSSDCRKETLELLFGNNLGGFDSIFFSNPKQQSNVTRRSIELNPYQFQADGSLADHTADGVFNPEDVVIGVDIVNPYTCTSEPLPDNMAVFAKGLIEARWVYARTSTGELYPVGINETNYTVNKTRLNVNNYRLTISFNVKGTSNIIFN